MKFTKHDSNKVRLELIPPSAIQALGQVLTMGASKYEKDNWRTCEDLNRYIGAAMRHLEQYRSGEYYDKESGLSHLSHCMTNLAFLIELDKEK